MPTRLRPVVQICGLGPLLRGEYRLHLYTDGAPRLDQVEPRRGGFVVQGAELRLGCGQVLEGRPQIDLGVLQRIPAQGQVLPMLLANASDAGFLGLGQVQGVADAISATAAIGAWLGSHGERQQDQEQGGPEGGCHGFLLGWAVRGPLFMRHSPGNRVESRQTGRVIRTCEAIVLKATPFSEGGVVVSFLSEHGERLSGVAKGAKKPTAKWVAAFEPLGMVRVSFFGKEHTEVKRVTRCELTFSPLTLGHLESSLVMACLADLFDRVAREGVEDDRLYRLLSACGRALKRHPDNALGILAYAEHWLLHCLGLLPHPRVCGRCGNESAPLAMLNPEAGWCCTACTPVDPAEALPAGARDHLRRLRTEGAEAAPTLDPADEAQQAITALLRNRLLQELGGALKSYDVLWRTV